ncbi:MAG: dephospho-CoA kinase [Pseudomonadales bacterium]|nr:dephospho-CoA kinase [Pseudomonadales bacterium]
MIIGLTGGIGSGKTAVSDSFAEKGITIVDADIVSRQVVEPGTPALAKIKEHFGAEVIDENNELDRRALRTKVFGNVEERKWLESILHPSISKEIWKQLQASETIYTVLASPLLFETTQFEMVNRTLVVDVPVELQISRTISRDDTDEAGVKAIIAAQMDRQERLSKADDVILNDKDLDHLLSEVDKLHETYLQMSTSKA